MIGTKEVYDIFDFIYPVGIIIELTVNTNPKELFGIGTWEPYMPGRVLVGAGTADSGTVYEAGTIGGEETHTLTVDGMPSHTHTPVISSGANVIQEFKLNNDWDGMAQIHTQLSILAAICSLTPLDFQLKAATSLITICSHTAQFIVGRG